MLKTKKFRRLLAGLLAVLMLSVCLPVGAFAADDDATKYVGFDVEYVDEEGNILETRTNSYEALPGQPFVDTVSGPTPEYDGYEFLYWTTNSGTKVDNSFIYNGQNPMKAVFKAIVTEPVEPAWTYQFYFYDEAGNEIADGIKVTSLDVANTTPAPVYVADLFQDVHNTLSAKGYEFAKMRIDGLEYAYNTAIAEEGAFTVNVYFKTVKEEPVEPAWTYQFYFYDEAGNEIADGIKVTSLDVANTTPAPVYVADLFQDVHNTLSAKGYEFAKMRIDGLEYAYNTAIAEEGAFTVNVYFKTVKEEPVESEDVNFRVEYVDENGQSLMAATNVATTYNDFEPSQKLADLLAKEIAEVEAEGYKQIAFTVVYEDGYETAPLNEPYVVPDYDGKTIKVYFAKVENYEDVNVRFEFVDMDGNTIQPATNYATSLSDSIVGPKVSEVLADEIDKLAVDGYDFDHYAWVLADGTETVLTDPVVVPDYDDTTIKVYFVKVEEYEDVHVRFEFVDMDGNSVLPATNYATCLSDSVVGPKVNDVLADELSTMEGRNYNFHHYAWVYSDGTETELDNDVIVVPDHDGTTIKVYFEAVKTEPSDPSTGDNTTTVTGKDEHPDIAEAKANGTWGAPTATPAAASTIPQTGDNMPVVMLIVIALAAAGAVGGLVVLRKRSHQ